MVMVTEKKVFLNKLSLIMASFGLLVGLILAFTLYQQDVATRNILEMQREITSTSIDALIRSYSTIDTAGVDSVRVEAEKFTRSLTRLDNSRYLVGFYSLHGEEDIINEIRNYLNDRGYTIHRQNHLSKRPSWLARGSTIFYYSKLAASKAQEIAEELEQVAGISLMISRGRGLGVRPGEESRTFFVHYVGTDTLSKRN